ncbi:MAG: prepilin-type N-terminal cleavage/methylation domain-containing protein [Proteobacteria bacterium]|nr:prepilin-type N-terminal cleavage/methylation domain-containing protein [Pseudomonadota bacterium]HQR03446.1 prepilin-type N-terminal cleavage/methylation domain-containing protein [Rhodocyclaceae bacterium]
MQRPGGFTLVELMVTVAIAAILLSLGLTSFNTVMASNKAKLTAESLFSGLRQARAAAIARNVPMRFQTVTTMDNNCAYSATSSLWVVTQTDAAPTMTGLAQGYCGAGPFTPPDRPSICTPDVPRCSSTVKTGCRGYFVDNNSSPASCSQDPLIAFKSDGNAQVGINVVAQGGGTAAYAITFSPLGRVITNAQSENPIDTITVSSTNPSANAWRIRIIPTSGAIRLCNPAAAAGAALACP